ncbi:BTAD domain-containing putative transcriptional regulator [Streptomyces hokutonensis]
MIGIGPLKQRSVLVPLIIDVRRPVMLDALVSRVWDDSPPSEVRNVLYTYVTRLRRILERVEGCSGERIELRRQSGGYLLDVEPERVDLHRFESLMARSRRVTDDEERARLQRQALSLWRGTPLADLRGAWFGRVREWIERRRLEALSEWAGTELRLGRPLTVIEEFGRVVTEQPYAEAIIEQLLLALSSAGRPMEALELYAAARRRIIDAIGAEPGPSLRRTHEAILREEVGIARPAGTQLRVPAGRGEDFSLSP